MSIERELMLRMCNPGNGEESRSCSRTPRASRRTWTMDNMSENSVFDVLEKMQWEAIETARPNIPRSPRCRERSIYNVMILSEKRGEDNSFQLTGQLKNISGLTHLDMSVNNPSFQWIKRHLKGIEYIWFDAESNSREMWQRGTLKYAKLKKCIRDEGKVKIAYINRRNGSIENLVDLFPRMARIEVKTDIEYFRLENIESLVPKISRLSYLDNLSRAETEKILEHKKLDDIHFSVLEFIPLLHYIREWQVGDRKIKAWSINCLGGTDVQKEEIFHFRNGRKWKSLTVQIKTEDGKKKVMYFVDDVYN